MSSLDLKALRRAFGSFMTGVTVVTTVDKSGTPIGFTANSFSSVSLDPSLLLVCPSKSLSSFEVFANCEHFHINILAYDQQEVSNIFATNTDDRFAQVKWSPDDNGCPAIDGAIASFSCARERSIDAGDHIILLGEVLEFSSSDKQGLGYGVGGYFSLNMERAATELQTSVHHEAQQLIVGALVEHRRSLMLVEDVSGGFSLPSITVEDDQPSFDAIHDHLEAELQVAVEVGSVFSIFDHENQNKSSIYYRVRIDEKLRPSQRAGAFHSIDELSNKRFSSKAIHSIVARYVSERQSGNHSLYVGTDARGKTHKIERGSK